MSQKNNDRPISWSDYGAYAAYRIFEFVLKLLTMKLVCATGTAIGNLTYSLFKNRRKVVTRNLRIAFGETMNHEEIHHLTRQTFQHSGSNLIASIRTSSFSMEELQSRVELVGAENLDTFHAQGRGIIGLASHMGNWELMAQLHLILPALNPPATLYRPINNPLIDDLIKRRRGSEGTKLFSRRNGFFKPIAHIKSGGSLGVLADQHAGAHGMAVPFFGKLTSMTNLPAIIHRRTGAPIVPISMASTTPGRWRITIHPAIDIPPEKKSDTLYITMLCAKAYETVMRTDPADVLWMHGYWKTGRKGPLKIDGLQKKRTPGTQRALATKPFRVIVYTGSATSDNTEMITQLVRLKNYRPDIHLTTVGEHPIYSENNHHIISSPESSSSDLSSTIENYDLDLSTPIDCALDFTTDASGGTIFNDAHLSHIFTLHGTYQSPRTHTHFSTIPEPTLADFLDSLGIQD